VLDEAGQIQLEQASANDAKALSEVFGAMRRSRSALEIGTHSPWISRLLSELGNEVIVGECAQGAADRGKPQERRSPGCATLARLARIDPQLLYPVSTAASRHKQI